MSRWALTGRAYSGKTTLARALQDEGYELWSFTDYLKELVVRALDAIGYHLTVEDIKANKAEYRRLIIPFSEAIQFDSARWVEQFIEEQMKQKPMGYVPQNVVWDNCRYPEQFMTLQGYGFKLLRLECEDWTQYKRAMDLGVKRDKLLAIRNDRSEQELPRELGGMWLDDGISVAEAVGKVKRIDEFFPNYGSLTVLS